MHNNQVCNDSAMLLAILAALTLLSSVRAGGFMKPLRRDWSQHMPKKASRSATPAKVPASLKNLLSKGTKTPLKRTPKEDPDWQQKWDAVQPSAPLCTESEREPGAPQRRLLFLMPTLARPSGVSYVRRAVDAILQQTMAHPVNTSRFAAPQLLVCSFSALVEHPEFAEHYYAQHYNATLRAHAKFVDAAGAFRARAPGNVDKCGRVTSAKQVQQTYDFAALLALAEQRTDLDYVAVVEDDALLCPHALARLLDDVCAVEQLRAGRPWSALRVGVGFTGVVLPHARITSLRHYMRRYALCEPVDVLFESWAQSVLPGSAYAEPLTAVPASPMACSDFQHTHYGHHVPTPAHRVPAFVERTPLVEHIGSVSSMNNVLDPPFLCGANLRAHWPWGQPFDEQACPPERSNIWPCE